MDKSIISVLENEFGDEWVKYKRGSYIDVRAIILSIFIELISQKNIIEPLFKTPKDFLIKYKNIKLLYDVIDKGESESISIYKININDTDNKISNDFSLNVLLSEKLHFDTKDIVHITNISKKLIKIAKEDKEKIFEYLIEQVVEEHAVKEHDIEEHDVVVQSESEEDFDKDSELKHLVDNLIVNKMWKISNYVNVCRKFINPEKNYGLIFKIVTKLTDGFMSEFNNGGCPTIHTQIREYIVKDILRYETKLRKYGSKKSKHIYDNFDKSFSSYKKRKRKNNTDEQGDKKKMCWIYSDGLVTNLKQNVIIPSHNDLVPGVKFNFVLEESIDEKSNMSIDFKKLKTKDNIVMIDDDDEEVVSVNNSDIGSNSVIELINNLTKKYNQKESMCKNFYDLFK